MDALRVLAFTWLSLVALWAIRRLITGERHTALIVIIVHWWFCGLPLLLDAVVGVPQYSFGINMAKAARNETATFIAIIYMSLAPIVIYLAGTRGISQQTGRADAALMMTRPPDERAPAPMWLYPLLILPVIAVMLAPRPHLYLTYGFVADDELRLTPEITNSHAIIALFCLLAVLAATSLIKGARSLALTLIITAPWTFLALFIHGKRHIMAMWAALLTWRLWERGSLDGARLPLFLGGMVVAFLTFSALYQSNVRGISTRSTSTEEFYENLRVDYGRDHTIRQAIHAELVGERILEPRWKSIAFAAGMYIPRTWWPDKPYAYGVYHTCYAMGIEPRLLQWAITTSILDEAIASCGWWGLLLGPLALGLLCRIADLAQNTILRICGILICLLIMATNLPSFMPLFVAWLAGLGFEQFRGFFTLRSSLVPPSRDVR